MPAAESAPLMSRSTPSSASRIKAGALSNEDVLRTQVPWASFANAGIVSREQLEMLYSIDQQQAEAQVALFHSNGTGYVSLFVDVLTGINKVRERACSAKLAPAPRTTHACTHLLTTPLSLDLTL